MKDVLLITHSKESSPGSTPYWCSSRNLTFDLKVAPDFFANSESQILNYRGIVIFGGDMEAWETEKNPWLLNEKRMIKDCIARKRRVFGICLGSQLLAEAFGSKIMPMNEWECGWYPVSSTTHKHLVPLHCHSSFFELPPGCFREAVNDFDQSQGFSCGDGFIGFQFHTEINAERLKQVIEGLSQASHGKIQTADQIKQGFTDHGEALQAWYFSQLDRWFAVVKDESHPS